MAARGSGKSTKKKSGGRANSAFMKPLTPSKILGAIVGATPLPRTQVVKKIWVYIKKHKLQDEVNRRMIKADAILKELFGGKTKVSMFDLTKFISKHLK